MCSLACKIKKNQRKTARKEKNWRKNEKEDVSRIMPLTDENKEKNAENLKKARKNDEKNRALVNKNTFYIQKRHLRSPNNHKQF